MVRDPIIGGIGAFPHRDMAQEGIGRRTQAPIADNRDGDTMTGRHPFDFRFYRTGIAVNKYLHAPSGLRIASAATATSSPALGAQEGEAARVYAALVRFLSLPCCQCGREPLRFLGVRIAGMVAGAAMTARLAAMAMTMRRTALFLRLDLFRRQLRQLMRHRLDLVADDALDIAQIAALGRIAEADGDAFAARSAPCGRCGGHSFSGSLGSSKLIT